jgi:hypothetical protein
MLRDWLSRVVSAGSIVLIGIGGGSLPVLDVVLFHGREPVPESSGAHYEATSGCHADVCAIRSTAQQVRFAPTLGTPERLVLGPTYTVAVPMLPAPVAKAPSGPPLSRSPPHLG